MTILKHRSILLIAILLLAGYASNAQKATSEKSKKDKDMKTYLIERDIPDAGKFTADDLKVISKKSCSVLTEMGPDIQWVHSYVTGNKIYCIYKAENEELIREHGAKGGFPVTKITEISSTISPATAN